MSIRGRKGLHEHPLTIATRPGLIGPA